MLDPRRQRHPGDRGAGRLEGVEGGAAGAVADGVDRDRQPARERPGDGGGQLRGRHQLAAALGGPVVGRQHRGGARAQGSVGEQLERPDPEPVVAGPALEPEGERARRLIERRGPGERTARYLSGRGFGEEAVEAALQATFGQDA